VLPEGAGRSENLFLGIEALPGADRILMATSDIPLATGAMYDDLLAHFGDEVDLGYTVVRHATVLADYADRPPPPPEPDGTQMPNWVTVTIRDGRFTGTPCMLLRPARADRLREVIKGIFDNREMGHVIGVLRGVLRPPPPARVGLAMKVPALKGLVSVTALERRMSRGLDLTCRAYVSPFAELAFDVDHLTDVAIAERVLSARLARAEAVTLEG
jgi:hypothetical protein